MKIIIQLSEREEAASPANTSSRGAPGMVLSERTYVLGEEVVGRLHSAGIRSSPLSREALAASLKEVAVKLYDVLDLSAFLQ